jgi:hypothetical protein
MKNSTILKLTILIACVSLAGYIFFKQTSHKPAAHATPDKTVNDALALELPNTISTVSQEERDINKKMMDKVRAADYEAAIQVTLDGLKKFPQSFLLQEDLASLLGDFSEITPEPLKAKMLAYATALFEKLLQETDGRPKDIVFGLKNEYYYRFAKYKEQYENGLQEVDYYWDSPEALTAGVRGYYHQGVGAANYARKLLGKGDRPAAEDYAQKAIVAWAQYFSHKNDYYNAYVHYAMALGVLGYKTEMMRALRKSAAIIKRDLDYFEFKEITDLFGTE